MLPYLPALYRDELVYSLLARTCRHSGWHSPKQMLDEAFGSRNVRAGAFLQTELGRLATNLPPARELTAHRLALENTILNYVTAFQPQEARDWALAAITAENDGADALHVKLGLAASKVRLPSALRYCPTCRAEMLTRHGELYWRRDHQLPGVLVCLTHGVPLADSRIVLPCTGQHGFSAADQDNCPADPPQPAWIDQPETLKHLRDIAIASAALLTNPPAARKLVAWSDYIRAALFARGFARGDAQVDQRALLDAYLTHFGPMIDILPDAAPDGWLVSMARKHRKSFAPLRHVLMQLLLDALPLFERFNPFGPGPWPCRNPLADHHGLPVVTDYRLHDEGGRTIGVFHCSCGYVFSTAPEPGSRAKLLDLGPLFENRLRDFVAIGASLRSTAKALFVDPKTVLRYVALLGLETPWKARPERAKRPQIERDVMRAAWSEIHTANPTLTRQHLRHQIPAVYTWLYRHDRNWLEAQPPTAILPIPTKSRFDWADIDATTARALRQEVARLRALTPPLQITRLALERALGQPGWLGKRLYKLPLCAAALAELAESVEEFQCRRITWAAEELRQEDKPVQVWRLRRLAGLPDRCAPGVEAVMLATEDRAA